MRRKGKKLNIIKIFNNDSAIIELSGKEKAAINVVNDILKMIEDNVKDDRDVFELKYAQKFLRMISSLENTKDITNNIDEILVDEDLFKEPCFTYKEEEASSFSESLYDLLKRIVEFNARSLTEQTGYKKKTRDKEEKEEYEQIMFDFEEKDKETD